MFQSVLKNVWHQVIHWLLKEMIRKMWPNVGTVRYPYGNLFALCTPITQNDK